MAALAWTTATQAVAMVKVTYLANICTESRCVREPERKRGRRRRSLPHAARAGQASQVGRRACDHANQ